MSKSLRYAFTGLISGSITGILGTGGGLVLIPMLSLLCHEDDNFLFQQSLSVMLPICICTIFFHRQYIAIPFADMLPFFLGGILGGSCAAIVRNHIPAQWLHHIFGLILIWSSIRCLFS